MDPVLKWIIDIYGCQFYLSMGIFVCFGIFSVNVE